MEQYKPETSSTSSYLYVNREFHTSHMKALPQLEPDSRYLCKVITKLSESHTTVSSLWYMYMFMFVIPHKNVHVYTVAHGQSTLQVCQREGWSLFQVFPHLTTKERPCHVYSGWMPSKQRIRRTVTYNGATNSFKVKS